MRPQLVRVWLTGLIGTAALLLVSATEKEVWQWTLEERIAHRTNPTLAQERVRRSKRVQTESAGDGGKLADYFDGKTHPELFLPHEVFDTLIVWTIASEPRSSQGARKVLAPDLKAHGLPPDFWERLQSITTIYVTDMKALQDIGASTQRQNTPGRHRAENALAVNQAELCRSGTEALAAARGQFGREKFDRFLYDVIAVHMFHAANRLSDPEALRNAAGGCR